MSRVLRVLLVGPPADRERLRATLSPGTLDIVGEFSARGEARRSGHRADGILVATESTPAAVDEPLTPREIDVLELLVEGLSNKAIAARLSISDQTVKFHVASISGKLGAMNLTDAVRRAIRRGLIPL